VKIERSQLSHAMCAACWNKRSSNHQPTRIVFNIPLELCCYCGTPTKDGIYVRAELDDPKVLCGGIHMSISDPLVDQATSIVHNAITEAGIEYSDSSVSFESLGVDSLMLASIYVEIEKQLNKEVKIDSIDPKVTVDDVIQFVAKILGPSIQTPSVPETSLKTPGNAGNP